MAMATSKMFVEGVECNRMGQNLTLARRRIVNADVPCCADNATTRTPTAGDPSRFETRAR
jgi:hypothetical protein